MSPPLKSFEGPDVEVLLARIHREVGPNAKIEGAEKIRVGGVLGFFAKEQYRVLVEVEDPGGVLRPIESDLRRRPPAHGRPNGRGRRRRGEAQAPPVQHAVVLRDAEPTSQVPVVGRANAASSTVAHRPSPLSSVGAVPGSGTDAFTALAEAMDDVNDVAGTGLRPGGAIDPVRARAPEGADAPAEPESFDAVLCRIASTLDSPLPTLSSTPPSVVPGEGGPVDVGGGATGASGQAAAGPSLGTLSPAGTAAFNDETPYQWARGVPDPGTIHVGDLGSSALATEAATFLARATVTGPPRETLDGLRRVGLGEDVVVPMAEAIEAGADLETVLLETFGRVLSIPPLPRRPGSLLVVAGPGPSAQALAAAVASEVGADPADVPFASLDEEAVASSDERLVLRSAEDAGELAPGWRRSRVAVVAVDAPLSGRGRQWAAHLIAALRPTAVWGVVDASCKTEDVRAWSDDLGGVDALALDNVDATVSPAAALGTAIPVARLDGRPASAARWTATIADRMRRCG